MAVRRYWRPGHKASAGEVTPGDAVERLEELLDQAVRRATSLGRLGIFLSGGVDSAVVAASATRVGRAGSLPDPLALSLVYPDPEASEERTQRTVADQLGIPNGSCHLATPLDLTDCYWRRSA